MLCYVPRVDSDGAWNRPTGLPAPVVAPLNEGMWRAAADGRLAVQRCTGCGAHRYPPREGCSACASLEWEWATLPGTGTVYAYSWVPERARSATLDGDVLYNVAVVELDGTEFGEEGGPVRMLTNVVDAWEPGDLAIGQAVALVSVPVGEGIGLPCFRRAR
jgi:uncharacterized OB-fold protein